jgi:hypothetical protein
LNLKIWDGAVKLLDKCRREEIEPEKVAPAAISAEVHVRDPVQGERLVGTPTIADFPEELDRLREWQRRRMWDELAPQ